MHWINVLHRSYYGVMFIRLFDLSNSLYYTYLEGEINLYCKIYIYIYIYNLSQNSNIFLVFILYRKSQKEMLKTEIKRKRLTNTFIDVETSRLQLGWMRRCVISIFQKLSILLIVIN